jgi:tRNA threonylcarbamoyladenosine biosynthesis protein TsaB
MRVLLIDTCGAEGSVAVTDTGKTPAVRGVAVLGAKTASERLMGAVKDVLAGVGWGVGDLEAVGVVTGPGSFTGVRTGLSVAKGLCEARGIPLVGGSRRGVMARDRPGLVHAALDAGRGEFYYGQYREGRCEMESLVTRQELAARLGEGRVMVCEGKAAAGLEGLGLERVAEPMAGDALKLVMEGLAKGENDVLRDANYGRRTDAEIFAKGAGR